MMAVDRRNVQEEKSYECALYAFYVQLAGLFNSKNKRLVCVSVSFELKNEKLRFNSE